MLRNSSLLIAGLSSRLEDMVVRIERVAPAPAARLQLLRVTWERTSRDLGQLAGSDMDLSVDRVALVEIETTAQAIARQAAEPVACLQALDQALQMLDRIDDRCRTLHGGGSRDFP